VEGVINECSLNGKRISNAEGKAYLDKVLEGQEISSYFKDIDSKE
jgi:hypothetical protein